MEKRRSLALSQADLAKLVDLSRPAWSKVERGITAVTVEHLCLIAGALRSSPAEILGEVDAVAELAARKGILVSPRRLGLDAQASLGLIGSSALSALIHETTGG